MTTAPNQIGPTQRNPHRACDTPGARPLLQRGHVRAESRVAVVLTCARCGAEETLVGRLLSELTDLFTRFEARHAGCVAVEVVEADTPLEERIEE